jgi:hypothetical protein
VLLVRFQKTQMSIGVSASGLKLKQIPPCNFSLGSPTFLLQSDRRLTLRSRRLRLTEKRRASRE